MQTEQQNTTQHYATNTVLVSLSAPLKVGETEYTQLTLRRPNGGDLRGCKLLDLLQMDVDAITLVLPRICTELPSQHVALMLDPVDLTELSKKLVSFFTNVPVGAT